MIVKMIEGSAEKGGKKKIMPPGKREKLAPAEIELVKAWIDAGAKPSAEKKVRELAVPKIQPKGTPRKPINALAYAENVKLLAAARYGEVELVSAETHAVVRRLAAPVRSAASSAFETSSRYSLSSTSVSSRRRRKNSPRQAASSA